RECRAYLSEPGGPQYSCRICRLAVLGRLQWLIANNRCNILPMSKSRLILVIAASAALGLCIAIARRPGLLLWPWWHDTALPPAEARRTLEAELRNRWDIYLRRPFTVVNSTRAAGS